MEIRLPSARNGLLGATHRHRIDPRDALIAGSAVAAIAEGFGHSHSTQV